MNFILYENKTRGCAFNIKTYKSKLFPWSKGGEGWNGGGRGQKRSFQTTQHSFLLTSSYKLFNMHRALKASFVNFLYRKKQGRYVQNKI